MFHMGLTASTKSPQEIDRLIREREDAQIVKNMNNRATVGVVWEVLIMIVRVIEVEGNEVGRVPACV